MYRIEYRIQRSKILLFSFFKVSKSALLILTKNLYRYLGALSHLLLQANICSRCTIISYKNDGKITISISSKFLFLCKNIINHRINQRFSCQDNAHRYNMEYKQIHTSFFVVFCNCFSSTHSNVASTKKLDLVQ